MIQCVTGFPGSGKSYFCAWQAYRALRRGRKVFSNYPIRGTYRIDFDDLVKYTFPDNSLVIIDEAGRWFNSRDWSKLPNKVFDLFTLHRHFRLDLLVAVQNFQRIDKALREVTELVWWSERMRFLPFFVYYGYYNVEELGKQEYNKRLFVMRRKKIFDLFDTEYFYNLKSTMDEVSLRPW